MTVKRRRSEKVTKADLHRCIRHLTKAVRQLTDAHTLLRMQVQTALANTKKPDER